MFEVVDEVPSSHRHPRGPQGSKYDEVVRRLKEELLEGNTVVVGGDLIPDRQLAKIHSIGNAIRSILVRDTTLPPFTVKRSEADHSLCFVPRPNGGDDEE